MNNEHKIKKYINKLKNTSAASDKFKIYLNKLNYYSGGAGDDYFYFEWIKCIDTLEATKQKCKQNIPMYDCSKYPVADKQMCEEQNKVKYIADKNKCYNNIVEQTNYCQALKNDSNNNPINNSCVEELKRDAAIIAELGCNIHLANEKPECVDLVYKYYEKKSKCKP